MKKLILTLLLCGAAFATTPTDLDSLFRGSEYKPVLGDSLRDTSSIGPSLRVETQSIDKEKRKSHFVLQFEAVADFDAAQKRKAQLDASTGYKTKIIFDAPFYKIRAGGWEDKKTADEKAAALSVSGVSVIVVKDR